MMTEIADEIRKDKWPEFNEILDQKVIQTLEKFMARHDAGKISDRELYLVASVAWDCISGLASDSTRRLLEAVMKEIKANAKR